MTVSHDVPAPYFFLSYAPLGSAGRKPGGGSEQAGRDVLRRSVSRRQASRVGRGRDVGFFDQKIPRGADWKQFITRALSAAQVFVPLYSVGYLTNSWPGRELTCFTKRVDR